MQTTKNPIAIKFLVLTLSFLLFVFSLYLPAFYTGEKHEIFPGSSCLLWGVFYLDKTRAWLGNPALAITAFLFFIRNPWPAIVPSVITLILMLTFLNETSALVNESGRTEKITGIGIGFWSWVSSAGIILVTAIYFLIKQRKHDRKFAER